MKVIYSYLLIGIYVMQNFVLNNLNLYEKNI